MVVESAESGGFEARGLEGVRGFARGLEGVRGFARGFARGFEERGFETGGFVATGLDLGTVEEDFSVEEGVGVVEILGETKGFSLSWEGARERLMMNKKTKQNKKKTTKSKGGRVGKKLSSGKGAKKAPSAFFTTRIFCGCEIGGKSDFVLV